MELASMGVDGVNFHGGSPLGVPSYYGAFRYDADGTLRVQPLYYGLRVVSLMTAAHGRVVHASLAPDTTPILAYATLGDDGATRVLLIEIGGNSTAVSLAGLAGTRASLTRMSAPSLAASTGLTLGGLSWDDSKDGHPSGTPRTEPLVRQDAGWVVPLGPYDAAVVEIH
jgi:hypothetical protein